MEKLKAKKVEQPIREPSPLSVTVEEIVAAVNAGLNPADPDIAYLYQHLPGARFRDGAVFDADVFFSI